MKAKYFSFVFALLVASLSAQTVFAADPIPRAKPEAAGFTREGLAAFEAAMAGYVDRKELAGLVTMTARHGTLVQSMAYGKRDLASGAPMKLDTIVRIASMTKPIIGVAMMMLYEEGKWQLDDPVSKFVPGFEKLKVMTGLDKDGKPILVPMNSEPTMRQIMSHTAGLTYDFFPGDVAKVHAAAKLMEEPSLEAFIAKLLTLPLAYQPGEGWIYSPSVDVQGYIVEKLSGQTLDIFLRERILTPLGMKDTGFAVSPEQLARVAVLYKMTDKGLEAIPDTRDLTKNPPILSGGGGLLSTGRDYLRFAQMLLNGGELDGKRYLKPETVALMQRNVVPDAVRKSHKWSFGRFQINEDNGFGLDFGISENPAGVYKPVGKGTYWWNGAFGTWFWIDPANDMVAVAILQRTAPPPEPRPEYVARELLYKALVKPSAAPQMAE